jgi:inner membrane protein
MDPLCHTLAGASFAHSGLRRLTPLAATTLVVGANLPDVDIVANAWGGDFSLCFRRGWTHGILALVVLPVALAGLMLLIDRVRRVRWPASTPARAAPLLGLSLLSVWSHPALDWLNTYGVRLLMPFSGRWFHGDAVFIIDPWLWLLLAAGVVMATTRRGRGVLGWAVLGIAISTLLFTVDEVPVPARAAWLLGVAAIVALRLRGAEHGAVAQTARAGLALSLVYVVLMVAGSRIGASQVSRWLDGQGRTYRRVAAGPLPVNPFIREAIVVQQDRYSFFVVNVITGDVRPSSEDVPINGPTPVTEAAIGSPGVRGLRTWIRFPAYEVHPVDGGYRVTIRDVRYARLGERGRGIGVATVDLDREMRPR